MSVASPARQVSTFSFDTIEVLDIVLDIGVIAHFVEIFLINPYGYPLNKILGQ